jgi:hypothetical protein
MAAMPPLHGLIHDAELTGREMDRYDQCDTSISPDDTHHQRFGARLAFANGKERGNDFSSRR